ncbi:hypothetical protein [Flavobacterium sp. N502540]|uniref:hypothetical protein n=1 Tax=Flavobacterium sp. N502540 TaxID=2986838 RepID=UPI002224BE74|nr:hypothetical protein [Flavobacterium sp. N502540]
MEKKLKQFFVKSFLVLLFIHLGYFLYGFFTFKGIANINSYFEFYRFKFYDDVSISHFFISGLFLFFFLIFLVRYHSRYTYSLTNLLKTGLVLLLICFLSFSFFISYSFGLNAKLRSELPEVNFNKDKTLLNVLNPFLYNYTSYSSEKLFNPVNILYPKPYPVTEVVDSVLIANGYYNTESTYYSIDTLKVLTTDLDKASIVTSKILDEIGLDKKELSKRIIAKKVIKDSAEILFRGVEVQPQYDDSICIFLENKSLFKPVEGIAAEKQQYDAAVQRYKLLYKYSKDSLQLNFQKLDTLLKKYKIESSIVPKKLVADAFYFREHRDEVLNTIRNSFDRKALMEKFITFDKLFYESNYLHPSIIGMYFGVIASVWLILFLVYVLFNRRNRS